MFKSYADFVAKPTILIMGAGASRDYGFPLWGDLEKIILDFCIQNPFPEEVSESILIDISRAIKGMTRTQSIDSIVTDFGADMYDAFQAVIGLAILQAEATDLKSQTVGWIVAFRKNLAETIISLEKQSFDDAVRAMVNLRFVSLNYDRVFQQRFIEPFFDDLQRGFSKGNARKIKDRRTDGLVHESAIGTFNLFQPHGTVEQSRAALQMGLNQVVQQPHNHDNQRVIPYGDVSTYTNQILAGWRPNARVVDDFDRIDSSNHPTYSHCNGLIGDRRVFLAGLSEAGITNSRFVLRKAVSVGTNLSTIELSDSANQFIGTSIATNEKNYHLGPYFKGLPL